MPMHPTGKLLLTGTIHLLKNHNQHSPKWENYEEKGPKSYRENATNYLVCSFLGPWEKNNSGGEKKYVKNLINILREFQENLSIKWKKQNFWKSPGN